MDVCANSKCGEDCGDDGRGEFCGVNESKQFRAIVARLNYISAGRPDMQFAVKEASRHMSAPRSGDWDSVIRIGKYLKSHPRIIIKMPWQALPNRITTYTDSDWAGCRVSGKSTSGGAVTIGKHLVKAYSRQQRTIALSSAEAELHAMVAASS